MRATSPPTPARRRRRHFRYRRFHALHLDLAMVLLLTVAGWSLCPAPRVNGRNYRAAPMTVEIRRSDGQNANDLLHYMRGFFELVPEPTPAQLTAIRNEILRATPVDAFPVPRSMPAASTGDCGCGPPRGGRPPAPALDPNKI